MQLFLSSLTRLYWTLVLIVRLSDRPSTIDSILSCSLALLTDDVVFVKSKFLVVLAFTLSSLDHALAILCLDDISLVVAVQRSLEYDIGKSVFVYLDLGLLIFILRRRCWQIPS